MRKIATEKEAQIAAKRDVCYLCGDRLAKGQNINRDHVPPKSIFLTKDRCFPLVLPTHADCNERFSISDEQTKQLIEAIHGTRHQLPIKTKFSGALVENGSPFGMLLEGLPLPKIIHRMMRGCLMALYGLTIPNETPNTLLTPIPAFDPQTGQPTRENFLRQNEVFCRLLKLQRMIDRVDYIHAYNGKFRFNSVWVTSDDRLYKFVICTIDIYGWHTLGDRILERPQGCIASYQLPDNAFPAEASIETKTIVSKRFSQPLNPWETSEGTK